MPRYVRPNVPSSLEESVSALGGNLVRIATLKYLLEHPQATAGEVAQGLGAGAPAVKLHLYQLTQAGLIAADPPPTVPLEDRTGRRVRYTALRGELLRHYEDLGRALGLVD